MRKNSLLSILFALALPLPYGHFAQGQQLPAENNDCSKHSIYKKWLNITVISSSVIESRRKIEILTDGKNFTECTLRWAFENVSKQFPQPYLLEVTATENLGNDPADKAWAKYIRQVEGEGFEYRTNGSHQEARRVLLRGASPFDREKR